jgi:hypothetical protein
MDEDDEVVLNVLIAEGMDVPTALVAAQRDDSALPPAPTPKSRVGWAVLAVVLIVLFCLLVI